MSNTPAAVRSGPSDALTRLFEDLPPHLTVDQLGQVLGVTTKTAYDYLQNGEVPAYRIGKRWIVLRDEIHEFLIQMRVR